MKIWRPGRSSKVMEVEMRKVVAEFIGTFTLVLLGCGTAMLTGCEQWGGYMLTAFAFGLTIVGMAYAVGNISGCHINPAVSLGCLISGRMSVKDFIGYVIAQCVGAFAGAGVLALLFDMSDKPDLTGGYGSNGLAGVRDSIGAGLIVEVLLTFIFVFVILGVTSPKQSHGSFGGVVIGFTLVLVHILGIGFTGTSINPARSLGPAIVAAIDGNGKPIEVVWIFVVAPFIGAAIAAIAYKILEGKGDKEEA